MKKKILNLIVIISLFIITGCENSNLKDTDSKGSDTKINNDDNNLKCSGKTSLMVDVLTGTTSDGNVSIWVDDLSSDYFENGEYTFIYDDVLTSIKGKETFKKSFSSSLTDEQIEEANEEGKFKVYKDSNGKVIFEYTFDKNEEMVKALGNKSDLKEWLEENSKLTCN